MPLSSEYTWSETNETVTISVPLKGVSHKTVDISTTSNILKINYKPFLLDLNLFQEIVEDKSKAVFIDGVLNICLTKKEYQLWGQLCFIGSKSETVARREKSLKLRDARTQQHLEMIATRKVHEERMMLREYMALEEKERQRMDDIKGLEKKNAEDAMFATFSTLREIKDDMVDDNNDYLPPPIRKSLHATFRHTPRLFKTPLRESTQKKEEEFIIKNRSRLRGNALLADTDVGNVDPVWLNSKGDEFYQRGDIGSAINAYSEALKADRTMIETLIARAACFLDLREAEPCIKDCLAALSLLDTSIEARFENDEESLIFRKKVLTRLGMAYCLNTEHDKALEKFHSVLQLDENDTFALQTICYLKTLMEVIALKKEADSNFSVGNLQEAKDNYNRAEKLDPFHIQVLMNRAACHLATRDSAACLQDCNTALNLLSRGKPKSDSCACALAAILLPTAGTKRKWQVILLCRRAAAKQLTEDFRGALDDLEHAKSIARNDDDADVKTIAKDVDDLKAKMNSINTKVTTK
jgi:tetratricopeptide (TPR) repeat protein